MAKHVRNTGEYNHNVAWTRWYEWQKENAELFAEIGFDTEVIKRVAQETGRPVDEVYAERSQKYYELQAEFNALEYDRQTADQQHVIIRNNSLDSACSIYQKADRILTNLPVQVFLNDGEATSAPAHNDGKNITFNATMIKSLDDDTVRSLHGLNYHELGHLLFTPRIGTALGKWVVQKENKIIKQTSRRWNYETNVAEEYEYDYHVEDFVEPRRLIAFNVLEDCRAERLLSLKYPSVKPFLIATISDYITENPAELAESFLLVAGRTYLDRGLRSLSALLYAQKYGEDRARAIYELTAEYRKLVFPRDYTRAQELITTLVNLLPEGAGGHNHPNGCNGRPLMRNGKPVSEKAQDELNSQDKDTDEQGLFASAGNEGDTNTGEIDPDHAHFNEKSDELIKKAQECAERAKADKQLQQKVRDTVGAIARDNSTKSILGQSRFTRAEPTQREVTASRLFGQELERLRIDCDPLWIQDKPTGKLNVAKAMNADINDINKLFNRWEMGNDDYNIEACILMDRSGSMWSEMGAVCRSAWVIKRAVEKINGRVSVMTFSDTSRTLIDADTKAKANEVLMVESSGGTDPTYALKETERIMGLSSAKTKLVFLLTDGAFFNSHSADKSIKNLKDNEVFTSIVFLGSGDWVEKMKDDPVQIAQLQHGADDLQFIGNPNDLVKVAKSVVRHQVKGTR